MHLKDLTLSILDCSSYLVCEHKKYALRHCPLGLQWHDVKQICDYPENSKCNTTSHSDLDNSNSLDAIDDYDFEIDFYNEELKDNYNR